MNKKIGLALCVMMLLNNGVQAEELEQHSSLRVERTLLLQTRPISNLSDVVNWVNDIVTTYNGFINNSFNPLAEAFDSNVVIYNNFINNNYNPLVNSITALAKTVGIHDQDVSNLQDQINNLTTLQTNSNNSNVENRLNALNVKINNLERQVAAIKKHK